MLDTLRLEFRFDKVRKERWKCEVMTTEHLELAIFRRYQKIWR